MKILSFLVMITGILFAVSSTAEVTFVKKSGGAVADVSINDGNFRTECAGFVYHDQKKDQITIAALQTEIIKAGVSGKLKPSVEAAIEALADGQCTWK